MDLPPRERPPRRRAAMRNLLPESHSPEVKRWPQQQQQSRRKAPAIMLRRTTAPPSRFQPLNQKANIYTNSPTTSDTSPTSDANAEVDKVLSPGEKSESVVEDSSDVKKKRKLIGDVPSVKALRETAKCNRCGRQMTKQTIRSTLHACYRQEMQESYALMSEEKRKKSGLWQCPDCNSVLRVNHALDHRGSTICANYLPVRF